MTPCSKKLNDLPNIPKFPVAPASTQTLTLHAPSRGLLLITLPSDSTYTCEAASRSLQIAGTDLQIIQGPPPFFPVT
jgi:hypothetical protein